MDKLINKTPLVRFPEFKDDWREFRLSELMSRVSKNNKDEEFSVKEILSLSSTQGIVDRKELLGDTYDKVNHKNYIKTRLNDLVYGKSISASYPYGLFKVNNCRDGLLSTLYFTFKVNDNETPAFLDRYFSNHNRANNFLKKYVLVGDRYITADANYILSGKIYIPQKNEQKKITAFLNTLEKKIEQLKQKLYLLEEYKKGVMQQLFTNKLRFKDENGKDYADWEEKKLGDLGVFKGGGTPSTEISEYWNGDIPWISSSDLIENDISNINVTRFITEKAISESATKLIPVNSVLFISRVGVGKLAVSKRIMCTSQDFANFIPNEIDSFYLAYYFMVNNNLLRSYAQGTSIKGFTSGDLKSIKISCPVLEEQQKIANFLSAIDDKINHCQLQITNTEIWKKGLLQQMFV